MWNIATQNKRKIYRENPNFEDTSYKHVRISTDHNRPNKQLIPKTKNKTIDEDCFAVLTATTAITEFIMKQNSK